MDEIKMYSHDQKALKTVADQIVNLLIKQGLKSSGVVSLPTSHGLFRQMIRCDLDKAHISIRELFYPNVLVRVRFDS